MSSQLLLGAAAQLLGRAVTADGALDIRVQGAIHLVLYLCGLWLLLRAARTFAAVARATILLAVLLVATDVAWVAPLNSFYGEAGTLVFLALLVGCGLHAARVRAWFGEALAGYVIACALFVAAKPQNYVLAAPLAVFPLVLATRLRRRRARVAVGGLALSLVALGALMATQLPWSLRVRNLWNNVFFTILASSPDPRSDLAAFGLEPQLARYAGTSAFAPGIPLAEATARYGFGDLLRFYLRRPARLWGVAADCAGRTFTWRDERIGNFPRAAGRPPGAQSHDFAGWSTLESRVLPRSLPVLLGFLGAVAIVGAVEARHQRGRSETAATAALVTLLACGALLQLGICVLGDGLYDAVKHLYLFQLLLDICLVAAAAWLTMRGGVLLARL